MSLESFELFLVSSNCFLSVYFSSNLSNFKFGLKFISSCGLSELFFGCTKILELLGEGVSEVEATSSISLSWPFNNSMFLSNCFRSDQASASVNSLLPSKNSCLILRSWLFLSNILKPFPSSFYFIDVSSATSDDSDSIDLSSHDCLSLL